ncbi:MULTISPECIES: SWIM zinc finger family protein [Brevibacillus]|uniref:SWIM zinc finger family protein n=1 Tax=Brevibacillus TaxID=55080 RepID=UPI00287F8C4F|nr:SWIM zinc finger family protein [Brevibacillus borstelensis]MED1747031.1 SWIM zinc finger family protein [Brevibacillus borstelensis]WNF03449.1 SWIM zinc finger family protein [Brevibacillus borstelensis]
MLQRELTREQVKQLGEQILVNMEEHIVEQGYQYFTDGMVFNVQAEDGAHLRSDVQGSAVYHVEIDLNAFANSTCTCSYARYCKHIAATFFQAYSVFENPRAFMNVLHKPRSTVFSPAMLVPAYKKIVKSGANPTPSASLGASLRPESKVSDWWSFLEKWTRNLPLAMETARPSSELFSSYENVLGVTSSWPEELAQLFSVHANLFHLLKLQTFVKDVRSSYWASDLTQTADRLVEQLEAALFYLDPESLRKHFSSHLEETHEKSKEWKHCDSATIYWIQAYRLLWWYLLNTPAWIQEEMDELDRLIKNPVLTDAERERFSILQAHFLVMKGEDEAALRIWNGSQSLALSFYLPYMKAFARHEEWERFLYWVDRLETLIGTADGPEYRLVAAVWREAMERLGRSADSGAMLKRFLPASLTDYCAYLFENRQYKQYLDVLMTYQSALEQMNQQQAKIIEDQKPLLLLPLLIREINQQIGSRNRSGYREAAKLLKKVRASYQKADQLDVWERFIQGLATKYSRLRAFQEELKRGNLIS